MLSRTRFVIVFGDEWMALYKDGRKVVEGVSLAFGDILEACDIPCELVSVDMDWQWDRCKQGIKGLPEALHEVLIDGEPEGMDMI